uniref:Uncharacterized protein n=1 Tax=Anguilla anguilla TaxID=7936 RepID=A0A0E9S8T6_ANGAN
MLKNGSYHDRRTNIPCSFELLELITFSHELFLIRAKGNLLDFDPVSQLKY